MSEHNGWVFSWNAWETSLRFHKYGFELLKRLIIAANTIFSNPKTANWKNGQKWVSIEIPLQYIVTYLDSTDFTKYIIPKSWPAHGRKNPDFFSLVQKLQLKQGLECLSHHDLWRRVIWRDAKNVMIFGFLAARAFQRYNMNDFTAIIFSRYYTLKQNSTPWTTKIGL